MQVRRLLLFLTIAYDLSRKVAEYLDIHLLLPMYDWLDERNISFLFVMETLFSFINTCIRKAKSEMPALPF